MILAERHRHVPYIPINDEFLDEMAFQGVWAKTYLCPDLLMLPERYGTGLTETTKLLRDPKIHVEQWQEVPKRDFGFATSHHDPPTICKPLSNDRIMNDKGSLKEYFRRTVQESGGLNGEETEGSWCSSSSPDKLGQSQASGLGFRQKYGDRLPKLRTGGSSYDSEGHPVTTD